MASYNQIIRIDDVKSDIDVRRKTVQLLAKIEEVDSQISTALSKAESLKEKSRKKHDAGWSFGGKDKRLAIEALQSVTRDMADSQEEIIKIQKNIVEGQKILNHHTTILYQLGAMSLTANRMVHRELKLKLENASREELSELARQELFNTIQQIEQMQDTLIIQEKQKTQLNQQAEKISRLEKDNDRLRSDMSKTSAQFSTRAEVQKNEISRLTSSYKKFSEITNQNNEKNSKDIQEIKKEIYQQGDKLQKQLNQQAAQLKQDEKNIFKLREDIEILLSETTEIESKYASQTETLNYDISALQDKLQDLTKNSYSKDKVWLIIALSVVISVILNIILATYLL